MADQTDPAYAGSAVIACPGCGAIITTADAVRVTQIPGGIQFAGVPCPACGKSFTVEIVEPE